MGAEARSRVEGPQSPAGVRRGSGEGEGQARVGGCGGCLPLLSQPAGSTLDLSEERRFPPLQLRLGVLVGLCKHPRLLHRDLVLVECLHLPLQGPHPLTDDLLFRGDPLLQHA